MTLVSLMPSFAAAGLAYVLAAAATGWVLRLLRRHQVLDRPNDRSHHTMPTPRGGGWGLMIGLVPVWALAAWWAGDVGRSLWLLPGIALLLAVSWADDLKSLGAGTRLACQLGAIVIALAGLGDAPVLGAWLPLWLDRLFVAIAWLWFVNLYNFMDGIDGITGVETTMVALGLIVLAVIAGHDRPDSLYAAAIAGAALGFLVWNWSPAKLFMGDVGSVPLGFLVGWLLIGLAIEGHLAAALILPLYYLADATLTLLRRLLRGEKFWQAHRQHAYQKAAAGVGHARTVTAILLTDAGLVAAALLSLSRPIAAMLIAVVIVAVLFRIFSVFSSRK